MSYETFDRILKLLIAGAVLIALALSFSARAEAATIAATIAAAPCLKPPAIRHKGRKPIAAPVASCVAPLPPLLADPEPIALPAVLTHYQDAPLPPQPSTAAPVVSDGGYISPWSGYDAGSFVVGGGGGIDYVTTAAKPTKPTKTSNTVVNTVNVTNIDNVETTSNTVVNTYSTTDITNTYNKTVTINRPPAHHTPEIDGPNSIVMLTWLAGSLLVIRSGKRL